MGVTYVFGEHVTTALTGATRIIIDVRFASVISQKNNF